MATSGTNTFNLDVDQVIEEAFERCGINSRSGSEGVQKEEIQQ